MCYQLQLYNKIMIMRKLCNAQLYSVETQFYSYLLLAITVQLCMIMIIITVLCIVIQLAIYIDNQCFTLSHSHNIVIITYMQLICHNYIAIATYMPIFLLCQLITNQLRYRCEGYSSALRPKCTHSYTAIAVRILVLYVTIQLREPILIPCNCMHVIFTFTARVPRSN